MPEQHTKRLAEGLELHKAGKFAEAEAIYREILNTAPDQPQIHNNRGVTLQELQRYDEALAAYDRAIALGADFAQIHFNRGISLHALKRFNEALVAYDRALAIEPHSAYVQNSRGNTLRKLDRNTDALAAYDAAINLQPDFADAHSNRGNALRSLRRHEEALASYDRALALKPDFAGAWYNRGFTLQELKRHQEALACYDKAIAFDPDYADAWWNKAFITLLTGDFNAGWPLYEWRWKLKDYLAPRRNFSQPVWRGDFDLNGKTILIHAEQGLGDTIHFCRYIKQLVERGAKVVFEVQPPLKALMTSLAGVAQIITQGEALPAFDCYSPLLSLPLAFKTDFKNLPADIPYFYAQKDAVARWSAILGERRAPRVGITWAGSHGHKNDRNRSMQLLDFLPLAHSGVELISLQKQIPMAEEIILAATPSIKNIGTKLGDFSDTAAVIASLDIVIAVDTAIAHLAGALGKPVWLLLPYAPEWRWLLDRDDSPWYPSARLFRQPQMGDWQSVIDTVGRELRAFAQRS